MRYRSLSRARFNMASVTTKAFGRVSRKGGIEIPRLLARSLYQIRADWRISPDKRAPLHLDIRTPTHGARVYHFSPPCNPSRQFVDGVVRTEGKLLRLGWCGRIEWDARMLGVQELVRHESERNIELSPSPQV